MLKLSNITKVYKAGDTKVDALKGINLSFRENEFVSILGPSGCGKTTLLNLICGLDQYTTGNLHILGKSTKEFKNKDWDIYRNHRVGFIFQSYNLIPHQTVLSNVELALTISGIDKSERIQRAKQALDKVGLSKEYYKKPNQLSGGQSQRVAVARALVNDPEILLADEPTGALDTKTSVQIMNLIKEIAKEKLVIMVTHNPELAHEYSTRIIKMLDGNIVNDSNPFSEKDEKKEVTKILRRKQKVTALKKEKAKMSFFTAFKLSLNNLFSKKGRTLMTSIAGSIGIIGVALVLSLSYGIQAYIDNLQNDMLSGNPITVSVSSLDLNTLFSTSSTQDKVEAVVESGFVNVDSMIDYLISRSSTADSIMVENNITQQYIDYVSSMPSEYLAALHLSYGIDITNNIYTDFYKDDQSAADNVSLSAIKTIYTSILEQTTVSDYADYITSLDDIFMQSFGSEQYILSQYNKTYGDLASQENEVMIVLDQDSELSDLLLAQLGYYTQDEFMNVVNKSLENSDYDEALYKDKFSYTELVGKTFTWYPNDTIYTANSNPVTQSINPFYYNAYSDNTFSDGIELTITGILEPKDNISYGMLNSGFYYTKALTETILNTSATSQIVTYFNNQDITSISSMNYNDVDTGIIYTYDFSYNDTDYLSNVGYVGQTDSINLFFGSMSGSGNNNSVYTLTINNLGGVDLASDIAIYPIDFEQKEYVLDYLDAWNSDNTLIVNGTTVLSSERDEIIYTDTLSIVIAIIDSFIQVVTIALVGFTALSLVVSSVMIGIITYVSVVERINEIGVIRSLGGRKKDVSNLFNAETFIIGLTSGVIGIGITYILTAIINAIVFNLAGIASIAIFPVNYALIMVAISVSLTLISGIMPSRSAAKKDPVVALRSE